MTLHESSATAFAAPDRIAVATDLSDTEYLLPYAIAQAKASHASLVLIHAVLPHESAPIEAGAVPYYDPLRMDRDARLMLESLGREVHNQGIECATAVRHGFVPDVVAEVVRNSGVGRLILGTHGRRGLRKFVLGSVARQLLETVDVPVCTIGPRAHKGTASPPATVLHPVSLAGWHEASAALSFALARQFGAKLVLLHLIGAGAGNTRDPIRSVALATEQLRRLVPREAQASTEIDVRISQGAIVTEILSAADRTQADLVVLGVHAPAHSWLPGTEPAAYKILVSAPCPVLSLSVNPELSTEGAEAKEEVSPVVFG
jgi:nucleotide-binding universal stress UspA family protein